GTPTLTVNTSTTSTYAGVLGNLAQDSLALTKSGSGTLVLAASNSYTGTTTINNGVLRVTAKGALGATSARTSTAAAGTLDMCGVNEAPAEPVTISGAGGVITASSGTSSFAGPVTLSANGSFDAGSGAQLTMTGQVSSTGTFTLSKTGAGTVV